MKCKVSFNFSVLGTIAHFRNVFWRNYAGWSFDVKNNENLNINSGVSMYEESKPVQVFLVF